jgi:hypothetical protein
MTEPIKPALTAEEWTQVARWPARIDSDGDLELAGAEDSYFVYGQDRHSVAALALYNQPFGFTREDVNILNNAALLLAERLEVAELYANLAARINALLPLETS